MALRFSQHDGTDGESGGRADRGDDHGQLVVHIRFACQIAAKGRAEDKAKSESGTEHAHPFRPAFLIRNVGDEGLARRQPTVHHTRKNSCQIDRQQRVRESEPKIGGRRTKKAD